MTLERYWSVLLKRWKIVIVCFLVVGVGAFAGSKLMTPLYQSSALIQVAIRSANGQADYTSLLSSDQLVQTEASLATSDPVLRSVASHYPGLTVQQLVNETTSTVKLNTQLFEIDVVDPSPARAAKLANDIAGTLRDQQAIATEADNDRAVQQVTNELTQTQQKMDMLTAQIAALQTKGGNQAQIASLQVQLDGLKQHYAQWQTLLSQVELSQSQNNNFLRIAQYAQPAISPVRPNVLLNTGAGLLAGLFLGVLLAVLFEQLDTRVRTPEDVGQLLEWPVLATVWRANTSNGEEVINPKGRDANIESYRILRTNIGFSAIDRPVHSMLISSPSPGDGKSAIATNLAIFMAKAGKSTLLIDADLRRPTLHTLFGLPPNSLGLSNAILAFGMQAKPTAPIQRQYSSVPPLPESPDNMYSLLEPFIHTVDIPNLWVMPSGPLPPNPSELLDSKSMQRFMKVIDECGADVVIFDTPPMLGLSDTSILASKVDGVLVVVNMAHTKKGKLKQLKAVLAQVGANANILGCVINMQRKNRNDSAYTYYYYYTTEQDEEHQPGKNGHAPATPVPHESSWAPSQFEQGKHAN